MFRVDAYIISYCGTHLSKNQKDFILAMAYTHMYSDLNEERQNKAKTWLTDVSIKAQLKQSYLQCAMNILVKRDHLNIVAF